MTGYKVFNSDWTCLNFKYEVGKTYEMECKPECCVCGFHFCENLRHCFNYYDFNPNNKVAIVDAFGDIDVLGVKSCTNKISIVKEITWEEVLNLVNTGKGCSGFGNSGHYNSGDRNSGNYNSGNYNSGNHNAGNYNSGDYNSGDYNSGDWNIADYSSGVFNTKEGKILMFNKPSNWTYSDWVASRANFLLSQIKNILYEWVCWENMTHVEKEWHPECITTGGYLKKIEGSECAQEWWNALSERNKNTILSLPNFDAKVFWECTGINVNQNK